MLRRAAVVLLATVLAFAGLTVGACPQARCAMRQAPAMDCCRQAGPDEALRLSKPNCCPPVAQIAPPAAPAAVDRPADTIAYTAALAVPVVLPAPAPRRAAAPSRIDPGLAPPGTLITQHTALLL